MEDALLPSRKLRNAAFAVLWALAQVHEQDAAVRDQAVALVSDGDLPELGVTAALNRGRLDPQPPGPHRAPDRGLVAQSDRPGLRAEPQIRSHARGRLDRGRIDPRMHDAVLVQVGG